METTGVSDFLVLLGRTSTEAGVLVVLVLATQWLFRRQLTPRWRCALWLLVAARLVLPFSFSSTTSIFNLLPRTAQIKSPFPVTHRSPVKSAARDERPLHFEPENGEANFVSQNPTASAMLDTPTATPAKPGLTGSWPIWIFAGWLGGVLMLGMYVTISSVRSWRRCAPLPAQSRGWTMDALRECCAKLQLRHAPALLESSEVCSPALHGLFRPRLLLPKGFTETFSPSELRFVFLHELAHLKRRDLLVNWIVVVLQIVHWFNPLVWFGFARWRAERELACDAMALEAAGAGQNKEYGRTILRLLDHFTRPLARPGLVGILEDKRQLHRRIGMIASYVPTQGWPRLAVALIGALAVIGLTDAQKGVSSTVHLAATAPVSAPFPVPVPTPVPAPATAPQKEPENSLSTAVTDLPYLTNTPVNQSPTPQITKAAQPATETLPLQEKANTMNTSTVTNQITRIAAAALLAVATSATPTIVNAADTPAAPAASDQANPLIGAWILVGTPDHIHKAASAGGRIKLFTASHWCITQADPKTGVVFFHHGGTYTINGNTFHANLEFANPSTMDLIGHTNGNFTFKVEGDTLTSVGIDNPWKEVWKRLKPASSKPALPDELTGFWVYEGKPDDKNRTLEPTTMKFCAGGYWCDTDVDAKTGVVVVHHGGICAMKGDRYVETCQYGNPTSMPLIGGDAKFDLTIEGDKLTLKGIENPWNEVWKRMD